ncbi:MAG: DUF2946 family protein [Lysobacter sp.]|nr:DUF2946 family protein [Lysobacter sp.]
MSRPAAFQRSMARLALLAMLALALLPGIGRIAQQTGTGAAVTSSAPGQLLGAICTTQGLAYDPAVAAVEAIGFAVQSDDPGRGAPSSPHPDSDCDYCAVTASTLVPTFVSLPASMPQAGIAPVSQRSHVVGWHYPLGLGSRGPPLQA